MSKLNRWTDLSHHLHSNLRNIREWKALLWAHLCGTHLRRRRYVSCYRLSSGQSVRCLRSVTATNPVILVSHQKTRRCRDQAYINLTGRPPKRSSRFERVVTIHILAALDLGAGVQQTSDYLIIQNCQAVLSMRRPMDWALEDNMVDGLFFCAPLTAEAVKTRCKPAERTQLWTKTQTRFSSWRWPCVNFQKRVNPGFPKWSA